MKRTEMEKIRDQIRSLEDKASLLCDQGAAQEIWRPLFSEAISLSNRLVGQEAEEDLLEKAVERRAQVRQFAPRCTLCNIPLVSTSVKVDEGEFRHSGYSCPNSNVYDSLGHYNLQHRFGRHEVAEAPEGGWTD